MITSESHRIQDLLSQGTTSPLTRAVYEVVDDTLVETLCAFANMPRGGFIVIGLGDNAQPILLKASETLESELQALSQDHIQPALQLSLFRANFDDQPVLVANVPPADPAAMPFRVVATHQAYIRSERGNYVLSPSEVQQLQDQQQEAYDLRAVNDSSAQHLNEALVQRFLEAVRHDSQILTDASDTEILQSTGVMTTDGLLTVAGVYTLGRYPQQFFPNLRITATSRNATTEQDATPQRFEGPLPVLLENAVRWVIRQAGDSSQHSVHGLHRTSIPIVAIREVITNALIHRSLSPHTLGQSVQLEVVEGELTVTSPGGLHKISLEQLGREPRETAVNPSLYEICRFVSVEGGHRIVDPARCTLREVHWVLRRAGVHAPAYLDSGLQVIVTVGRRDELTDADTDWLVTLPSHDRLTTPQRYLLVAMSNGKPWNTDELYREFGPAGTKFAISQLAHLAELGLVRTRQDHDATRYWIDKQLQRDDTTHIGQPLALQSVPNETPAPQLGATDHAGTDHSPRDNDDSAAARAAAVSKHGATLWNVLREDPMNIHDLAHATKLSLSQTRYGVQRLVSEGIVLRTGGQGHRETTYRRSA
ncbi:RNA-binding domain-containing protein [Enteractinococcus coprophilus]|uniref:ATP-dependent DNA helicase RecG n=1 Tax=Enteractinococcus coprophilus TaxID=1027633 RepID=A0A543ANK3_9MICC|nr:RNA-binding domain-containing protein [Enteractinococcus coprophilus]TQL74164.1 ATP-dependent DNA helicase RecG [Enteractinococcus coprophilus]